MDGKPQSEYITTKYRFVELILFMFIGQLWQVNAIQEGATAFIRAMIKSQVLLIALPAIIIVRMKR